MKSTDQLRPFLSAIVFHCIVLFIAILHPSAGVTSPIEQRLRATVLPIVALEPDTRGTLQYRIFGTGFVFQWRRRIVTSASIIDSIPARYLLPQSRIAVLAPPSEQSSSNESHIVHTLRVTTIDRALDVALLEADSDIAVSPLEPASLPMDRSSSLVSAGFLEGTLIPIQRPVRIAGTLRPARPRNVEYSIIHDIVGLGSGGGPIVDSNSGHVHGLTRIHTRLMTRVVTAIDGHEAETPATAVVVPIRAIMDLLDEQRTRSQREQARPAFVFATRVLDFQG